MPGEGVRSERSAPAAPTAALGRAAACVVRDPAAWARWGTRDEVLQYVKQLWHVLVRFGRARGGPAA
ncbi:DUF3626 domain-containing protein [Streptomyces niveus]|uniref:DUF3626 domain-containing protein n=1 Tax=Streptomyces niveus TaxID=193462 RepID=UPI003414A536